MSNDKKDFSKWHIQKSILNDDKSRVFFHEREVWFASVGLNVGYEQDGRGKTFLRPVVILRKFNNEILWSVPLTHTRRTNKYYISIQLNNATSTAILSQIKLIDSKRLQYKVGTISQEDFIQLKEKLRQLLA